MLESKTKELKSPHPGVHLFPLWYVCKDLEEHAQRRPSLKINRLLERKCKYCYFYCLVSSTTDCVLISGSSALIELKTPGDQNALKKYNFTLILEYDL